jgi:Ser/Thr protein kinase RdoA (MazF antagonist)
VIWKWDGLQKLSGGLANSNYRVDTTTGSYLLKICDEKDKQSLQVSIISILSLND